MLKVHDKKIFQSMPSSIKIADSQYGQCIISTQKISKNTVIDSDISFCFIANNDVDYELIINDDVNNPYVLNSLLNTLYYTENERVCNGYIGYLNHSCFNSNVIFKTSNQFRFDMVTIRDIEPGDEIKSNYFLFDYYGLGHKFCCACGHKSCYGNIHGFGSLSLTQQLPLVNDIMENVLKLFIDDNYDSDEIRRKFLFEKCESNFSNLSPKSPIVQTTEEVSLDSNLISQAQEFCANLNISEFSLYTAAFIILFDKLNSITGLYHCQSNSSSRDSVSQPSSSSLKSELQAPRKQRSSASLDLVLFRPPAPGVVPSKSATTVKDILLHIYDTESHAASGDELMPPPRVVKNVLNSQHSDFAYSFLFLNNAASSKSHRPSNEEMGEDHANGLEIEDKDGDDDDERVSTCYQPSRPPLVAFTLSDQYILQCVTSSGNSQATNTTTATATATVAASSTMLVSSYVHVLQSILSSPIDTDVASIQIMEEESLHRICNVFNNGYVPPPSPSPPTATSSISTSVTEGSEFIFDSIERHAATSPETIALSSSGQQGELTYGALCARMCQLAALLQSKGVEPEQVVGVMLPRNTDLVVALLGVLRSGGAYCVVLPDFPLKRIEYMLFEDCHSKIVITVRALQSKFASYQESHGLHIVLLDEVFSTQDVLPLRPHGLTSHSLCYITYTSGSTGKPKGVLVEHAQLCLYVSQGLLELIGDKQWFLHSSSATFDIIAHEVYMPLSAGKSVYVIDNLMSIGDTVGAPQIGFVQGSATLLENTQFPFEDGVFVSQIGEKLTKTALRKYGKIWNGYGTAETTCIAIAKTVSLEDDVRVVGKPFTYNLIYILSSDMSVLPVGVKGEIYIGGPCLSRGYLNLPQLTNEKFITNPYGPGKLYRTGDMGQWTPEGEVLVFGREDAQVKRNGVRIELGELEQVACDVQGVHKAVAIFTGQRLLLFWRGSANSAHLQDHLRAHLPNAMIPNEIIYLENMPLNANGKIDKAALPQFSHQSVDEDAPQSAEETKMVQIWSELFPNACITVSSDFLAVGGDSMRIITLVGKIKKAFGVSLNVSDVYTHLSLKSLVLLISSRMVTTSTTTASAPLESTKLSFYQMHYVDYYQHEYLVKITFRFRPTMEFLNNLCSLLATKFPALKTRLSPESNRDLEQDPLWKNLDAVKQHEFLENADFLPEKWDPDQEVDEGDEPKGSIDLFAALAKFYYTEEMEVMLLLSHIICDAHGMDLLYKFIDAYCVDAIIDPQPPQPQVATTSTTHAITEHLQVDNYKLVNAQVDNAIRAAYDGDYAFWKDYLQNYKFSDVKRPLPKNAVKADGIDSLSVFDALKYLNDAFNFPVIFYVESSNLRYESFNNFNNGTFVLAPKGSSAQELESIFRFNLQRSTIPLYIVTIAFDLKNIVYYNFAPMKYDSYRQIQVDHARSILIQDRWCGHYVAAYTKFPDSIEFDLYDDYYEGTGSGLMGT